MDDKVSQPSHGRLDPMVDATSARPHQAPNQEDTMNDQISAAADLTAQWTTALDKARTELTAAESAGSAPADAAKLAARRLAARETVQIAEDALAKAQAAELLTRREAVAHQADTLARQLAKQTEELAAKRAAWHAEQEIFKDRELEVQNGIHEQAQALELLTRQQQALTLASRGQDVPGDLLPAAELPGSLQPGGVLPVPAALAAQQAAQEAEDAARVREDEQHQLDAAWAILAPLRTTALAGRYGRVDDAAPDPNEPRYRATDAQLASLERAMAGEKHLSGEQREALTTMARLVSHGYAEALAQDILVEPADQHAGTRWDNYSANMVAAAEAAAAQAAA